MSKSDSHEAVALHARIHAVVLVVNFIPLAQSRESGDAPSHGGYAKIAVPFDSLGIERSRYRGASGEVV